MTCSICNGPVENIMSARLLNKYSVAYFQCQHCQFIQTETPYWLDEAYSSAIASLDIGLIYRNELSVGVVQSILSQLFDVKGRFLDFGGGYGMFVRMMRDRGYDFYRYDTYCENLFAKGFDIDETAIGYQSFEVVTAFEVFEHLVNPIDDVKQMLRHGHSILFSTEIQPNGPISPDTWWYVLPETGQHIALYSRRSLEVLAEQLGLRYISGNNNFHLFTDQPINPRWFSALTDWRTAKIYNLLRRSRQPSLLNNDFQHLRSTLNNANPI